MLMTDRVTDALREMPASDVGVTYHDDDHDAVRGCAVESDGDSADFDQYIQLAKSVLAWEDGAAAVATENDVHWMVREARAMRTIKQDTTVCVVWSDIVKVDCRLLCWRSR